MRAAISGTRWTFCSIGCVRVSGPRWAISNAWRRRGWAWGHESGILIATRFSPVSVKKVPRSQFGEGHGNPLRHLI
jgi:hypothetical protein